MTSLHPRKINQHNADIIIEQSQSWIDDVIVRLNICPFAKAEVQAQTIHYRVVNHSSFNDYLEALWQECVHLDQHVEIATTLIVFSDPQMNFDEYLDLVDIAEQKIVSEGYEGIYQLASFHPDYCFDMQEHQDAANFTNRSPYPMLHLIREADIEKALSTFIKPEMIPERNIEYTRRKGYEHMQGLLESCYDVKNK